jgi:hypothetical protein
LKPTEFILQFDESDPVNMGRPRFFDPEGYCDVVEQMLAADEVIGALKMLDMVPSFYREKPTKRMIDLRQGIYHHTWNVGSYVADRAETYEESLAWQKKHNPGLEWKDLGDMIDIPFTYPRGPLMAEEVKALNNRGITPFIWEMGPANYWLPYGLIRKGLKFHYYATTLQKEAFEDHKERLKEVWKEKPDEGQHQIFVCFETIEHLWDHKDILHQYYRYGAKAETIFMSTPCGTLFGGMPDWHRELGHLRTFTMQELLQIANELFPGFRWEHALHHMMVIKGNK